MGKSQKDTVQLQSVEKGHSVLHLLAINMIAQMSFFMRCMQIKGCLSIKKESKYRTFSYLMRS